MKKYALIPMLLLAAKLSVAQRAVTSEEALTTAHHIEETANSGDPAYLNRFVDIDSLLANARKKSHALKDEGFYQSFSGSFKKSFAGFGGQIIASIKRGDYRFMRQYVQNGEQHLVFRMFGDGGLNYHDYTLMVTRDSVKASDVYIYLSDEPLSTTLANFTDIMDAASNENERLPEEAEAFVKLAKQINQKNYAAVKEGYEKLGEKIKHTKMLEYVYVTACHRLDNSLYVHALEQYAADFPDLASAQLMMIDVYYLRKEYEKGIAAIQKMDKQIGEDAALEILRGNFYKLAGKKQEAIQAYEKAYHIDPAIALNARLLILNYETTGEKVKARTVFAEFKKTKAFHDVDFSDLLAKYPDLN